MWFRWCLPDECIWWMCGSVLFIDCDLSIETEGKSHRTMRWLISFGFYAMIAIAINFVLDDGQWVALYPYIAHLWKWKWSRNRRTKHAKEPFFRSNFLWENFQREIVAFRFQCEECSDDTPHWSAQQRHIKCVNDFSFANELYNIHEMLIDLLKPIIIWLLPILSLRWWWYYAILWWRDNDYDSPVSFRTKTKTKCSSFKWRAILVSLRKQCTIHAATKRSRLGDHLRLNKMLTFRCCFLVRRFFFGREMTRKLDTIHGPHEHCKQYMFWCVHCALCTG